MAMYNKGIRNSKRDNDCGLNTSAWVPQTYTPVNNVSIKLYQCLSNTFFSY